MRCQHNYKTIFNIFFSPFGGISPLQYSSQRWVNQGSTLQMPVWFGPLSKVWLQSQTSAKTAHSAEWRRLLAKTFPQIWALSRGNFRSKLLLSVIKSLSEQLLEKFRPLRLLLNKSLGKSIFPFKQSSEYQPLPTGPGFIWSGGYL